MNTAGSGRYLVYCIIPTFVRKYWRKP